MKRLLNLIRLHPRLFAGAAVILLAGTALLALRSAGSAHAAPAAASAGGAAAKASNPALALASLQTATKTTGAPAAHTTASGRHTAAHSGRPAGHGIPAPPPTSQSVSNGLKRATGLTASQVTVHQLCPPVATGRARCAGETLVQRSNGATVHPHITARGSGHRVKPASGRAAPAAGGAPGSSTPPDAFTPAFLQQAYDLTSLSQTAGSGDTVAIVDAYDDPTAASDLNAYRSFYGLPACTTANGCFRKVNQRGGATPPSISDPDWTQEISLDLDAVSAICPNCNILLVEADSTYLSDLGSAIQTAHALGANQISNSWTAASGSVPSGTYTFPGVATVAATGDAGYIPSSQHQDNYPAGLAGVTAAGGTTLAPTTGGARGFGEGAWTGGGSGCDRGVTKPAYQTDTGCHGRTYADLSADADPATGLSVYENGAWALVGGTSLASPMIAAYYAITATANTTPQWAYANRSALNDIVSGSNGGCTGTISYVCNAGPGYDGPTGVGSISGDVVAGAPGIGGPAIAGGAGGAGGNTYTKSIRADGATITGGIYPNGHDTSWSIQYWPADGSGSPQQTAATDIGSGAAPVTVTGYPSHLTPSTQYDYQLVASNSAGTIYGYTYSFTTSAASATAPTAAFAPTPAAGTTTSPVTFDASGSTDSGATIIDYSWDFGDGSTADEGSGTTARHTYAAPGTYNVTLMVTNSNGESESTTQTVTVDTPPTASFTVSPSPGVPATFDASGSTDSVGTITSYSWDFGDPGSGSDNTATGPNPTHTYAARGPYTVTLTVTNDAGQTATSTQAVTVDDAPIVSLSPTTQTTTPNGLVSFNVTATSPDASAGGTIRSADWNFGDQGSAGNTASGWSASHTYASPGTYRVTVTVTDDLGVTATKIGHVTVDAPPAASFTASSSQPSPGAGVMFDPSGSSDSFGTLTTYSWNFGDPTSADNTASGPNHTYSHTYATRGTYTVTLTVTNDADQDATTTQTVTVDDPPTATLTPSTTLTVPGSTVSFGSVAASPDTGGSIKSYSWTFGDPGSGAANTATAPNPSHLYGAPGVYPVTMTVTDDLGVTTTTTAQVTVDAAPAAAFTVSRNPVTAGSAVGFDASGSSDSVGTITGYRWNFGDPSSADNTSTGRTPSHLYGTPGTYTASLTVTNDAGQSTTLSATITVYSVTTATTPTPTPAPPSPTPTPTPAPGPAPAPAPTPLSASLGGATKQKLATVVPHGLGLSLTVNQGATATFQVTLPVRHTKLVRGKPKTNAIVLLHTRAQAQRAGTHTVTLKLSRAAARQLSGTGPLVLTVRVTLKGAGGTVTRTLKITLTR